MYGMLHDFPARYHETLQLIDDLALLGALFEDIAPSIDAPKLKIWREPVVVVNSSELLHFPYLSLERVNWPENVGKTWILFILLSV